MWLLVSFLTPNFSYQAVPSPYLFNKKLVTNIASISIVRDGECEGNITKITLSYLSECKLYTESNECTRGVFFHFPVRGTRKSSYVLFIFGFRASVKSPK